MNRRTILQLAGATFFTSIGTGSAIAGQEAEDDEEEEQETEDDQQEGACIADIQFGEQDIVIDDTGHSDERMAG